MHLKRRILSSSFATNLKFQLKNITSVSWLVSSNKINIRQCYLSSMYLSLPKPRLSGTVCLEYSLSDFPSQLATPLTKIARMFCTLLITCYWSPPEPLFSRLHGGFINSRVSVSLVALCYAGWQRNLGTRRPGACSIIDTPIADVVAQRETLCVKTCLASTRLSTRYRNAYPIQLLRTR